MNKSKIKSMKLYNNVGRIFNELREIGKDESKLLKVEDLIKFDQLHYCGIEAVDFAIKNTQINSNKSVLEIGSGIGGPARYIAYKTRASITALELQADQHKIAVDLTKKCDLLKIVNHIKKSGVPIICFPRGIKKEDYADFCSIVKPSAINIDYEIDPEWIKNKVNNLPIQGGLDPKVLLTNRENVKKNVDYYLNVFSGYPYIFNLGHGVLPETNPSMIEFIVQTIREKNI